MYSINAAGTNGPGSSYLSLLMATNGSDTGLQIAGGYVSDALYFRGTSALNTGSGWTTWRTVLHDGNYTSLVKDGTLTLSVNGSGLSGAASFTANQAGATTFTVTSNATTAATANTLVYRDSSADIFYRYSFSTYVNTTDDVNTGSITYVVAKFGDNYHRSASAAKVQSFLGLGTAAYTSASSYFQYDIFTEDANTMPSNRSGFTYALNAPATGPIAYFDASGYGFQINAPYTGGTNIYYRTKNGDTGTWNAWYALLNSSNYNSYSPYTNRYRGFWNLEYKRNWKRSNSNTINFSSYKL